MVTRGDAETSRVSASPVQARPRNSLSAVEAIRRGDIKISHPILHPDIYGDAPAPPVVPNTPSSVTHAAALNDTRPPQPPQFSGLYDGRPPTRGRRAPHPHTFHGDPCGQHPRGGKSVEVVLPSQLHPRQQQQPPNQQKRSSLRISPTKGRRGSKMNRASYETDGDDFDDDGKEKRGSGSLRAVFRKMFGGSKSRRDEGTNTRRPATRGQDLPSRDHWAENERKLSTRDGTLGSFDPSTRRRDPIMDLAVREITPKTPLGSHLPFPMNVNAPQESPPRQSFLSDPFGSPGSASKGPRRRATLPSLVISQSDLAALTTMWDQNDRDGATDTVRKRTPTPDIGMAITSTNAQNSNRRSRSADALADVAWEQSQMARQVGVQQQPGSRAAEIAYWRASYAPLGVDSRDFGPVRTSPHDRKRSSDNTNGTSIKTAQVIPTSTNDEDGNVIKQRTPVDQRQSFERPSLDVAGASPARERPATSHGAFASMRGHARNFSRPGTSEDAPPNPEDLVSRLSRLEQTVKTLQTANHRSTLILDSAPKGHGTDSGSPKYNSSPPSQAYTSEAHVSQSPSEHESSSHMYGAAPRTPKLPPGTSAYTWSQTQDATPDDTGTVTGGPRSQQNFYNPTGAPSTDTAPAATAAQAQTSHAVPSSLPSPNIYDHLAPLYAALRYERSKRKEFEVQMAQVQQDLLELKQFVHTRPQARRPNGCGRGQRNGPAGYPTPSPEDTFGGSFSSEDHAAITHPQQSRFSGLEYDSESDYGDTVSGTDERGRPVQRPYEETDAENSAGEREVYGTPREEFSMALPPEPNVPQRPQTSRIPTPKQSLKNMRPSTAGREVRSQPSQASLGNGLKNRFGFPGGKM